MGVELHLSTLSSRLAKSALDSRISHNIDMIASEATDAFDSCVTGGILLTVSVLPKYEPSDSLLITFLALETDILALAEAVTRFLDFGRTFFPDGILKIRYLSNFKTLKYFRSKILIVN